MINGIIKLFYSEVVKTKMKTMPSSSYELREECRELKNITLKIDSIFFKMIKFIIGVSILIIAFNISLIFGIGMFLVEVAYVIYKRNIEQQVKESIDNIKNNIEINSISMISDRGRSGINVLLILLSIGIFSSFNWAIVLSFVTVFLFTIKDIYSNIK
ncbi:MAG: hypothetical protein RRZ84_01295 [Romboutsia sp.]